MRVACLAQLVNVIAPIVTNDTGVLRQSTYYPYSWALKYAKGRVLDLRVESEMYPIRAAGLQADFARNDQVPFVDIAATLDAPNGQAAVLMLNRDTCGEREVTLDWGDIKPTRVLACETLTGADLKAFNTFEQPRKVAPQRLGRTRGRRTHDVQAAGRLLHGCARRRQHVITSPGAEANAAEVHDARRFVNIHDALDGRLPAREAASEPHLPARLRRRSVAVQIRLLRASHTGSRPRIRIQRTCVRGERGHVRPEETVFVLRARLQARRGFRSRLTCPRSPRLLARC